MQTITCLKQHNFLPHFKTLSLLTVLLIYHAAFVSSLTINQKETSGLNFKFVVIHSPPYDTFIRKPNNTFTFSGVSLNILQWIAVKIELQDIEGITLAFLPTLDRIERMGYTIFPCFADEWSLVVPRAGKESRLFAFVRPFQPPVWLLILITVIITLNSMTLFTWLYNRYFPIQLKLMTRLGDIENKTSAKLISHTINNYIGAHMIYIVNVMTNQGCKERIERHSFRILSGFWLLGAMVLVNSYSGIVISSLTVPKIKPSIDSFKDLAESQEVGLVLRHEMIMGEQILNAKSGLYKILGDKVRQNPEQIVGDYSKLINMLEKGKYAFPFANTFTVWFVASQYQKEGKCRFKVTKPLSVPTGYFSWLTKKGSPNLDVFSRGLMEIWETGLTHFWVDNILGQRKAAECFANNSQKNSARQVAIRLLDLTSAFLILAIGLGSAIICFLLEFCSLKRVPEIRRK